MDRLPLEATKHFDLGYLGIEDDFPDHTTVLPRRKPLNRELPAHDKRQNRRKAIIRLIVEHAIAKLKKFQILAQTYRNTRARYNQKFQIIAGLVNLRMSLAT